MILCILVLEIEVDLYGGLCARHLYILRANRSDSGIRLFEEGRPAPVKEGVHPTDILPFDASLEVAGKSLNGAAYFLLHSGGILFLRHWFWNALRRLGWIVGGGFRSIGLVEERVFVVEGWLCGELLLLGRLWIGGVGNEFVRRGGGVGNTL